jgi:hypothetical protein
VGMGKVDTVVERTQKEEKECFKKKKEKKRGIFGGQLGDIPGSRRPCGHVATRQETLEEGKPAWGPVGLTKTQSDQAVMCHGGYSQSDNGQAVVMPGGIGMGRERYSGAKRGSSETRRP